VPTLQQPAQQQKAPGQSARVAVIAERRYLSQAQPSGMIAALRRMGHSVMVIDPQSGALEVGENRWTEGVDVAIARGRSWGVLCLLDCLERQGVPSINTRSAIASVHNKAEMAVALAAAGIPTPRTWLGPVDRLAAQIPSQDYPVIIKPIFGDNCRGLQVVHTPHQLKDLDWPEGMAIAQRFFAGLQFDLKLYCIGREVWAVRKPSPLEHHGAAKAEPVVLTAELRNLTRRCGELFNLELFGVDCIETEAGPLVIEVNEFPNYSAVPGADEKLSNFVLAFAKQEKAI
jgi:glutathione synthase/RimK-type ligase-like ATP-grasp enzyme